MSEPTPEISTPAPEAAPPEQPDTVIERGVKALNDLRTSIENKVDDVAQKTEDVKKWYNESRDTLSLQTATSLNEIKQEVAEIQKMDKSELAKEVLENINSTINSIVTSTRSELANVFNSFKTEGLNFINTVRTSGLMEAIKQEGGDLLAGGMRLFDSMRNSAAFAFGPLLKMMGLDEMVGGDRILLANALKKEKIKGMHADDSDTGATLEYVSEQYDAHFASGPLPLAKPEFYKSLVSRLTTEVLNNRPTSSVTYKQLNDAADSLVKDQQEAVREQPVTPPAAPAPITPTSTPPVA